MENLLSPHCYINQEMDMTSGKDVTEKFIKNNLEKSLKILLTQTFTCTVSQIPVSDIRT